MKLLFFSLRISQSFIFVLSLSSGGIPGIWKLYVDKDAGLRQTSDIQKIRSQLMGRYSETEDKSNSLEILLKLNPDGSFKECGEDYEEGCWLSGRWTRKSSDCKLLLAIDRQYYGPRHDVLLEAKMPQSNDDGLHVSIDGKIVTGKFMYSKDHPSFFDDPIVAATRNETGNFSLEQALSSQAVLPYSRPPYATGDIAAMDSSHLFGRKFHMTVEPLELPAMNKQLTEQLRNQPQDIRAMPIQFFGNQTFEAIGINKILRGRFQVYPPCTEAGRTRNELWLQVSLFGSGRSAPGSVYSEGKGLTHDDKRTYMGEIVERRDGETGMQRLFVSGTITIGDDMGSDARPEPVGAFLLFEKSSEQCKEENKRSDTTDADSVFE